MYQASCLLGHIWSKWALEYFSDDLHSMVSCWVSRSGKIILYEKMVVCEEGKLPTSSTEQQMCWDWLFFLFLCFLQDRCPRTHRGRSSGAYRWLALGSAYLLEEHVSATGGWKEWYTRLCLARDRVSYRSLLIFLLYVILCRSCLTDISPGAGGHGTFILNAVRKDH